jgi:hypothetical protein
MPSALETAQNLLNATMAAVAAETLRVVRDSHVLCDAWKATPGRGPLEIGVEGEATIVGKRRDWLGNPDDWRLEGVPTKPQRGDLLYWDHGGYIVVFEAVSADGEDVWSPAGTFENRIRVHTKVIEHQPLPT